SSFLLSLICVFSLLFSSFSVLYLSSSCAKSSPSPSYSFSSSLYESSFAVIVSHLDYCDYIFTCIHTFFWAVVELCSNVQVITEIQVRCDVIDDLVCSIAEVYS